MERPSYSYIEGLTTPRSIQQFVCILQALCRLHENDYVHADVRQTNIVFSSTDNTATIIDFDMAGEEGAWYPMIYYNHIGIEERHPQARACMPRRREHDLFALGVIIERCFGNKELAMQLKEREPNIPKQFTSLFINPSFFMHVHWLRVYQSHLWVWFGETGLYVDDE